ncbi:MAG: ribonuclease PH [Alphaproteobacteria bacterium]
MNQKHPPAQRSPAGLRALSFQLNPNPWAEGSCRILQGQTEVLVTASLEERLPPWRRGARAGWVTAEYAMLPRATTDRNRREVIGGKQSGRTMEIQRLIGRALRAVHNLEAMGERLLAVDADVLVADGGTRVASINGASIACASAWHHLQQRRIVADNPMPKLVAAVSCAWLNDTLVIDPDYEQDKVADVDGNLVLDEDGKLIEVQLGAEGKRFNPDVLNQILNLAQAAAVEIIQAQRRALSELK